MFLWKTFATAVGGFVLGFAAGMSCEGWHNKKIMDAKIKELENERDQFKQAYLRVQNERIEERVVEAKKETKETSERPRYSPNPPLSDVMSGGESVNTHKVDYAGISVKHIERLRAKMDSDRMKSSDEKKEEDISDEDETTLADEIGTAGYGEDGPSETEDGYTLEENPYEIGDTDWNESFDDPGVRHKDLWYYTDDDVVVDEEDDFLLHPETIIGSEMLDRVISAKEQVVYLYVPQENTYYCVNIMHGRNAHQDILGDDGKK